MHRMDKQEGLLYSRENYIQYSIKTIVERNIKKEYICVCVYIYICINITESLCCTAESKEELKSLLMKVKEESKKLA